jgi:hypothetical protein
MKAVPNIIERKAGDIGLQIKNERSDDLYGAQRRMRFSANRRGLMKFENSKLFEIFYDYQYTFKRKATILL